jgi:YHS domain-containing protein
MAIVTDPVCGMRIEADDAAATAEHRGSLLASGLSLY